MNIIEIVSAHTVESILAVLVLCLCWTHFWTHKTRRDVDTLHNEIIATQANMKSEIRDMRRRLSNTDNAAPSFSNKHQH